MLLPASLCPLAHARPWPFIIWTPPYPPGTLFLTEDWACGKFQLWEFSSMELARCQKKGEQKENSQNCFESKKEKALLLQPPAFWLCPFYLHSAPKQPSRDLLRFSTQNPHLWEETKFGMGRPGEGSGKSSHHVGCSYHSLRASAINHLVAVRTQGWESVGSSLTPAQPHPSCVTLGTSHLTEILQLVPQLSHP